MKYKYAAYVPKILVAVLILLAGVGCQSMSSRSVKWEDLSDAQRDSIQDYLDNHRALKQENKRLASRLESLELDYVKLKASYDQQVELNKYVQDELESTENDLETVERQFVSFEQRLTMKETKASAVAASAEVHLLFDRLNSETPGGLDSLTVTEVSAKLGTSEEMIKKHSYAAAVYFANRAMRILNQAERRNNLSITDGHVKVISVPLANLRDGPGSRYAVIGKLSKGTVVTQIEDDNGWTRIRTGSGKSGWVYSSLIR